MQRVLALIAYLDPSLACRALRRPLGRGARDLNGLFFCQSAGRSPAAASLEHQDEGPRFGCRRFRVRRRDYLSGLRMRVAEHAVWWWWSGQLYAWLLFFFSGLQVASLGP